MSCEALHRSASVVRRSLSGIRSGGNLGTGTRVQLHDLCLGRRHVFCRDGCCLVLADRGSLSFYDLRSLASLGPSPHPPPRRVDYEGNIPQRRNRLDCEPRKENLWSRMTRGGSPVQYLVSWTPVRLGFLCGWIFFLCCAVLWISFG